MADETNVVLTANTQPYERSVDQATQSTNRMIDSVARLTTTIDGAFKAAGRTMTIGGAGMTASITAMGFAAGRLEQQMSQLQASMTMVSRTQEQYQVRLNSYAKSVTNLRSEFGMTSQEAIQLVSQLNKLGQTDRNVNALAQSFTRLSAVSGEGVQGLVSGMVQLQRTMGTEGVRQTQVFNATLAQLSQSAGASATGILQFSQAIAPVAKVSGMTQKEVLGISTAFVKSGADGYAAANAFNKMLTDITRSIQYGSPELKAYSNLIGVSVEQFKELPRTEAITRVFEQINKQGPEAIKTLERFGLDGIRTYKSLQAVAGQGGIRAAVADAMGGGDASKLGKASDRAFDGLNDQLKRIAENGKMIAEAFGSGVLPVMEKVARAINSILSPLTQLIQGLSSLPGGAMAIAGLGAMAAGGVISHFTGLSTLGMAAGGYRTLRGGYRAGSGADLSDREQRQLNSFNDRRMGYPAAGNWLQHMMFGGANRLGEMAATRQGGGSIGLGRLGERIFQGARGAGILAAQGLGGILGAGLAPLSFGSYENNMNRDQRYQAFRTARAADAFGWQGVRHQYNNLRGAMGSETHQEQAEAYRRMTGAMNTATDSTKQMSTATRQVGHEFLRFGSLLGQAAVTTGRMAGTGLMNLGGAAISRGARGLWSGLGTAAGMAGGPIGLGMMAGFYGYSQRQQNAEDNLNMLRDADNTGPGGVYAAALGQASAATRTFAEVVKSQAAVIASQGFTMAPSAANVDLAGRTPGQYTFAGMRGASGPEQVAYAQLLYASNPSDEALSGFQQDLLRRNGTSASGQIDAAAIMGAARARPNPNMAALFTGAYEADTLWGPGNLFKTDTAARNKASYAGSGIQQLMAAAPNATAASGIGLASLNQLALSFKGTTGPFGIRRQGGDEAMALAFVRGILGKAGTQEDIDAVVDAMTGSGGNPDTIRQKIAQSGTEIGNAVEGMTRRTQAAGGDILSTTIPNSAIYRSSWAGAGVEDIVAQRMASGNALQRSVFGDVGSTGAAVRNAVANQGDTAAQWTGMQRMGEMAIQLSGNFAQAAASVDQLKAAAGDASSPLYQLAVAARGYIRQRQTEAMGFMDRSGQARQLAANYREDLATDLQNPTAESGQNREQSRQGLQGFIQQTYDRLKSFALSVREFNVSRERGEADFARQQQYNLEDYNRSRAYAEDDYNRQRGYAQEDFNRSRRRQEEDFNHQVVVMARETAKTMTNIYERLNVQRTWSAQNLLQNMADQQRRLEEQQAQLAKLRDAGLSNQAISQMGLNSPQNMQQLARLADDMLADRSMIGKFNAAARNRVASGGEIATDPANDQFAEMRRSFNLNMSRGQADFNRGMRRQEDQFALSLARQAEQYSIAVDRMVDNYQRSMDRAAEDLNRSMEDITGTFNELADAAMSTLTGSSREQMGRLLRDLGYVRGQVYTMTSGLISDMNKLYMSIGISTGGTPTLGGKKLMTGTIVMPDGSRINAGQFAAGGEIQGTSGTKRDDNVLIRATPGEYMQPVDSVEYYGKDFMEKLRKREIPRAVAGLAEGGMVYQQMSSWLKSNLPGVAITSSYRPGAITALGNVSMHAQGKALDLAPSMETFNKILTTFGNKIHQLFYSPADGRTILRGKPWKMDSVTKGDHWDHVHWAMQSMTGLGGLGTSDPKELLRRVSGMKNIAAYDRLMTGAHPYALRAHGNGFLPQAITSMLLRQMGSGSIDVDYGERSSSSGIKAMVRAMAATRGWTGGQWSDLDQLVQHESGWNPKAQNPSSTAYGLFQFLNSTWRGVGGTKTSDPRLQAQYGLKYIAQRYGNPSKAWDFWNSHTPHWYGDGAIFNKASQIGVGERGPEAVMPLNQRGVDFMFELMKRNSTDAKRAMLATGGLPQQASTVSYYQRVDKSTIISGAITVQAQDPDEMIRKIEAKKKMEALKGRH